MKRRQESRHSRNEEVRTVSKQGHSYTHSRHLESHSESRSSSSRHRESRHHARVGYHKREGFGRSGIDDRSPEQNEVKRPRSVFTEKGSGGRKDISDRGTWHLEEIHRHNPESFVERQNVWSLEPHELWRHRRSFEMDERRHHKRSRSRSIDEPQDSRCHDLYLHGDARPGWRRSLSPAFDHPLFNEREILNGYSNGSWRDSQQRLQRSEHSIERFEQCERYGRNNFREVRRSRSRTSSPFRNRNLKEDRFRVPEGFGEAVSSSDRSFIQSMPIDEPSNSHYRGCDSRPSTFSTDRCTSQNQLYDRPYNESLELLPNIRQMVGGLNKYVATEQGRSNDFGLSPAQKARARKLLEELLITVSGTLPNDVSQENSSVKMDVPSHAEQRQVFGKHEESFQDSSMWRGQGSVASSLILNDSGDLFHYSSNTMNHQVPYNVKNNFKSNVPRLHRHNQRRRV